MDASVARILKRYDAKMKQIAWYADWYKDHGRRLKLQYMSLRVPTIILGVIVPQLIAIQSVYGNNAFLTGGAIIASTLVAALSALDSFFRWGETYVDDKAAELALYSIWRRYDAEREKFLAEPKRQTLRNGETLYDSLNAEFEGIVGNTTRAFVERAKKTAATLQKATDSEQ